MKHLRIQTIQDIEKALWLIYRYIPQPPTAARKRLAQAFPYIIIFLGTYFVSIAILPFIFPNYPLDPLQNSGLFNINIILSRGLFALMGSIAFVSFERLVQKNREAWYNMFYLSLFHVLFVLVVFNAPSFALLCVFWYVLFAVKPEYAS